MTEDRPAGNTARDASGMADLPQELADRLDRLAQLPNNWDSYGAKPMRPEAILGAKSILKKVFARYGHEAPMPFIAPANDGTLVLEWKTESGKELILDVPSSEEPPSFLLVEPDAPEQKKETEGIIGKPRTLTEALQRLMTR